MTRPSSRVSVFQWKTWKGQTLETFCVTPKYWLCLYFEPLLFIHTKTIYKCSYFLSCIYIYITYTFICITYECIYIWTYICIYLYDIWQRERLFVYCYFEMNILLWWIFVHLFDTPFQNLPYKHAQWENGY